MHHHKNGYAWLYAKSRKRFSLRIAIHDQTIQSGNETTRVTPFIIQYAGRSVLLYGTILSTVIGFVFLQRSLSNQSSPINSASSPLEIAKDTGLVKVIRLAEAFKATLSEDQVKQLQLDYLKSNAVRWSNFPQAFSRPNRVGLALGFLNVTQTAAFRALMNAVLSQAVPNEGYDELEGVRAADNAIAKATGKTDAFGEGNYYIAFLGTPSATALWELQYGGHHYAFANTYNNGKIIGVTPTFRGTEPMTPVTVANRTYQPLEQERTAFATLLQGLNEVEKTTAKLSKSFNDVLLGPGKDGVFPIAKQGVKIGDLTAAQQQQALKAIELYVNDLDVATAKPILKKYTSELKDTYLAYAGSGAMNSVNDYVRIDGPSLWLEYSSQPSRDIPGPPHAHSVWRDRTTDYGGN